MADIFFFPIVFLILSGYSLNVFNIHFEVKYESNVAKYIISLNLAASVFQNTP